MKILCTSDLHGHWRFDRLPEADVMIFAGDVTRYGHLDEVAAFNDYLTLYPAPSKIVVAGNHDWCFYDPATYLTARNLLTHAIYLQDEGVTIQGVKFYGTPWTPQFYNWAFMLPRGELAQKWDQIHGDTQVLITHGPPAGQRDCCYFRGEYAGCTELREAVLRVKPKLHCFGHIHSAYGSSFNEHTVFLNVSRCTEDYEPDNEPVLFEL